MREKLLSISHLARLRKLTSETLRHYDRIGLIKPTYVDPETKYRYYSIRQYEELGTIKELRQLGMSLDTIVEYFDDRNLEKSRKILSEHCEKLRREMIEKQLLYEVLRKKVAFIDSLDDLAPREVVEEKYFPQRYFISYGEPAGGPEEHALILTKLEGHLNETAPILATDRIGVYGDESLLEERDDYIPSIPMIFLEAAGTSSLQRTVKAGRYLTVNYYDSRLERYHPSFELVKDYMLEHNLRVDGEIFQIYKLDVTLTSDRSETILELQVPVKDKE